MTRFWPRPKDQYREAREKLKKPIPKKLKPPVYEGPHPAVGRAKELMWRIEHGDESMQVTTVIYTLLEAVAELD